jgi:hypothetical protein
LVATRRQGCPLRFACLERLQQPVQLPSGRNRRHEPRTFLVDCLQLAIDLRDRVRRVVGVALDNLERLTNALLEQRGIEHVVE